MRRFYPRVGITVYVYGKAWRVTEIVKSPAGQIDYYSVVDAATGRFPNVFTQNEMNRAHNAVARKRATDDTYYMTCTACGFRVGPTLGRTLSAIRANTHNVEAHTGRMF